MITQKIYSKWMAETQRLKIEEILKHLRIVEPVLDVGSGPGFLEERIKAVALDVSLPHLKKFKGKRVLASGDHLPFEDGSFGTVFCIYVLHLLKEPKEIGRILAKGGQLVVSLPCNRWNCEEKAERIIKEFKKLKLLEKFTVKTEREWDAVAVFSKSA